MSGRELASDPKGSQAFDQRAEIGVAFGRVELLGPECQHRRAVMGVEIIDVGIAQTLKILRVDALLHADRALANPLQQGRR